MSWKRHPQYVFLLAGYTLIPFSLFYLLDMHAMNPRNFPDETPKKHLRGFIFKLCYPSVGLRKTFRKSAKAK